MKRSLVAICSVLLLTALPAHADEGRPHKGKMFEKHDTNGDGVISKSEFLAHAEERFSKMDADGNGAAKTLIINIGGLIATISNDDNSIITNPLF